MCFYLTDLDGNKISGKKALEVTIDLGIELGELATKFLKKPHDLEYEKNAMDGARFLNKNASVVNDFHPESAYIKPAIIEDGEFPILKKDINFDRIKKIKIIIEIVSPVPHLKQMLTLVQLNYSQLIVVVLVLLHFCLQQIF